MIGCDNTWPTSGLPVLSAAKIPSLGCLTPGSADVTDPWSFGLNPSDGEDQAVASYLCDRSDVKKYGYLGVGVPSSESTYAGIQKVLQACGKSTTAVYYPETATDVTPYVQKLASEKPNWVQCDCFSAQVPAIAAAFANDGIPASHMSTPASALTASILAQGGKSLDGILAIEQFIPWDNTSDPQLAAYLNAMKSTSVNPQDVNAEWGYSFVMTIYDAAEAIGFGSFDSATLAHFLETQNNFPISLSRAVVNPGPSTAPQEKEPYARMYQWTCSTFQVIPAGPAKDGWERGWLYS
jgi:hypothetical protein